MAAALATAVDNPARAPLTHDAIEAAARAACGRVAPLWPLATFVAVNPFFGFMDHSFAVTAAKLRRVTGAETLMGREFYVAKIAAGEIGRADLQAAIAAAPAEWRVPATADELMAAARQPAPAERPGAVVATIADTLDRLARGDRQVARTAFMVDEISKFCAAYFDEGQAAWTAPAKKLPLYQAWRAAARFDRNPETMGVKRFRASVAACPENPIDAIAYVVAAQGLPESALEDYLFRALFDIGGWAAYARRVGFVAGLYGQADDTLIQLLAVRLVWGYALYQERTDPAFRQAWAKEMAKAAAMPRGERVADDHDLTIRLVLHDAFERAFQRTMLDALKGAPVLPAPATKKPLQAAFCIDVRSEVYRRALEAVMPDVETIGFAGFFGFPIDYVPIGQSRGNAHCPVLLTPAFSITETIKGASEEHETEALGLRLLRRRAAKMWKAFKLSAVSSFTFVETNGLLFAPKLVSDSLGLTRPAPNPRYDGLDPEDREHLGPRIDPKIVGGKMTGFDPKQRVDMAEAVLRAMSLTKDFARIVLLAGHGSTTVNNPHAAGLDCGACGGHTGEANARVAAAILNDPAVRESLVKRGITISYETWFVPALHDTTTDEITLFDVNEVPGSHADDLRYLRAALGTASECARAERAGALGLEPNSDIHSAIHERSRDWSQVRPEWGLAGNAAFIAAPRSRTRGRDFGGRAFLHSYEWREDTGFKVLELIMTAPMVVASWINLQYLGSTTDNRAFGCGDKTLHNVCGQHGVLEGNAGDLRVGLPWQSLHDGRKLMHEPQRLNVVIEAPRAAVADVIAKHAMVRDLVQNGWLHLWLIDSLSGAVQRY
ncbi:MAG: DUF2309 domain-containing protein [Sphingomonadaceae bacterium]|nr:DUF2309 domain-containing protein [Sphingomonadaceae bacterium]